MLTIKQSSHAKNYGSFIEDIIKLKMFLKSFQTLMFPVFVSTNKYPKP